MSGRAWFALGAGLAGVVAYVLLLGVLADALVAQRSAWGVVGLVVLVASPLVGIVVGLFWLWARTTSISIAARGAPRITAREDEPALEGEYRPALEPGKYANGWPLPALPEPRDSFLPVLSFNGKSTAEARIAAARADMARAMGAASEADEEEGAAGGSAALAAGLKPRATITSPVHTAAGSRTVRVDVEAMRKVCMVCPEVPTRGRCGVTSSEHSDCLDILAAHGWVVRPNLKGQPAHWVEGASRDVLLAWLAEAEERGTPGGAR
jgi:hypothetical protein